MSATDELRKMMDERGVEHYDGTESTLWLKDEHGYRASADELTSGRMSVHIWCDTPEQAIAATLGAEDAYTREDVESAFVSGFSLGSLPVGSDPQWDENRQTVDEHMAELGWVRAATLGRERDDAAMVKLHDRMNVALLEYQRVQGIEKRDGDGEIVVPFVAEMHRLLEEAATLGDSVATPTRQGDAGTCYPVPIYSFDGEFTEYDCNACSECGTEWEGDTPNYCPYCGARVVEVDE